jgi:hypothetical protein
MFDEADGDDIGFVVSSVVVEPELPLHAESAIAPAKASEIAAVILDFFVSMSSSGVPARCGPIR